MAMFKMVRDALPPPAVAEALPLISGIAARTGGRFSFANNDTTPQDRLRLLAIVETFLNGPVADLFRTVHGVEPCLCLSFTTVRFQSPANRNRLVDWHLDLNFVGDDKPFLVAWTATEDVGVDRVAIDVCVPASQGFGLEAVLRDRAQKERNKAEMTFSDDELDHLLGRDAWTCRPVIAGPGTAAVFDQFILHRSQVLTGASKDRYSIEFRLMDPDDLPVRQKTQKSLFAMRAPHGGLGLFIAGRSPRTPLSVEAFKTLRIV